MENFKKITNLFICHNLLRECKNKDSQIVFQRLLIKGKIKTFLILKNNNIESKYLDITCEIVCQSLMIKPTYWMSP